MSLPPELLELARDAWVGIEIDALGARPGHDHICEIGICVQTPTGPRMWSSWVYAPEVDDDDERAAMIRSGRSAIDLAPSLQQLAGVARGFVSDVAFAYTAPFLAAHPWRLWGPWHDVRARARAADPTSWTQSLARLCDHWGVARPWPGHRCAGEARAVLEVWLAMDSQARAA